MLKKKINRKNMIDSIIEMSMVQVSFIHFLFEMALDI